MTILDCMPQLFFRPKYVWFPINLKGPMIPDPSGQFAELIVYITSTRVDLYSHQILLTSAESTFIPSLRTNFSKTWIKILLFSWKRTQHVDG